MSMGDIRSQVTLELSKVGDTTLDDVAEGLRRLAENQGVLEEMYREGSITLLQYNKALGDIAKTQRQYLDIQGEIQRFQRDEAQQIANSGQQWQAWGRVIGNATESGQQFTHMLEIASDELARQKRESDQFMAAWEKAKETTRQNAEAARKLADEEKRLTDALDGLSESERTAEAVTTNFAGARKQLAQAEDAYQKIVRQATQEIEKNGSASLETINGVREAHDKLVAARERSRQADDEFARRTGLTADEFARTNRVMGGTTEQTMAATRAVFFMGQALEDLQYGFGAVANNLPMIGMELAQAMGMSAQAGMGLGAAVSLVATTINAILLPALKSIIDSDPQLQTFFQSLKENLNPLHVDRYSTSLETMSKRISDLSSKKIRLAVEDHELDVLTKKMQDAERAKKRLDEALTGKTEEERAAGEAFQKTLEGMGGERVLAGPLQARLVKDEMEEAQRQATPIYAERQQLEREQEFFRSIAERRNALSNTPGAVSYAQMKVFEIQRQIDARNDNIKKMLSDAEAKGKARAGELIGGATSGDQAQIGLLMGQVRQLEGGGAVPAGMGAALERNLANAAAGLPTQEELERQGQQNAADIRRGTREKAAAERKKADDDQAREREQAVNQMANLYRTKYQEQINQIVARGLIDQKAERDIAEDVGVFLLEKMEQAGAARDIRVPAARQSALDAAHRARMEALKRGDTVGEGAEAMLTEAQEQAEAKAEREKRQAEAPARAVAGQFDERANDEMELFLLQNRMAREQMRTIPPFQRRNFLANLTQQRRQQLDMLRNAARQARDPRERQMYAQQFQMLRDMPVAPVSDDQMVQFLGQRMGGLIGQMPGENGQPIAPQVAAQAGQMVANRAREEMTRRVVQNQNELGDVQSAIIAAQQQIVGALTRAANRNQQNRRQVQNVQRGLQDFRQTQLNVDGF